MECHASRRFGVQISDQQAPFGGRVVTGQPREFLVEILEAKREPKRSAVFLEEGAGARDLFRSLSLFEMEGRDHVSRKSEVIPSAARPGARSRGTCILSYPINMPPLTLSTLPVM